MTCELEKETRGRTTIIRKIEGSRIGRNSREFYKKNVKYKDRRLATGFQAKYLPPTSSSY